jgi:hypothetical protein
MSDAGRPASGVREQISDVRNQIDEYPKPEA